jgi:hypothetical protein
MAMPVPKELLEAAAKAAAEVHADLAEEAESDAVAVAENEVEATMGMQAVPQALLDLVIDPETGELTGGSTVTPDAAEAAEPSSEELVEASAQTMFEQPAITGIEPEDTAEPLPEPSAAPTLETTHEVTPVGAEVDPPAPAAADAGEPVTRSQLRTIVLAAVGLGILATLVPVLMTLSSDDGDLAVGRVAMRNFPSHANVVGNLSLDRLRQTWVYDQYGERVLALAVDQSPMGDLEGEFGVKVAQIDAIALGAQLGDSAEPPRPIVAITGRFDTAAVEAALQKNLGPMEEGAPASVATGFYGKNNQAAGLVDENTILGGSVRMLAAAVAARSGTASMESHRGLMAALDEIDSAAVLWGGLQVTEELLATARGKLPAETAGLLAVGDAVALSLSVEEDLDLRIALYVLDEARATGLREALTVGLAQLKLLALAAGPEHAAAVQNVLNGVTLEQEGSVINVRASLPRALVQDVVQSALGDADTAPPKP